MKDFSKFDGYPIELYDGRFSGTFEMDEASGEGIKYEQSVCFLVVAHASKAAISTNKDGDVKRTNTFAVQRVEVIPAEEAEKVLYQQGSLGEIQLEEVPFLDDSDQTIASYEAEGLTAADRPDVDPETGEVFSPGMSEGVYDNAVPPSVPDPKEQASALDDFLYGEG